jgi:hypothetical protein
MAFSGDYIRSHLNCKVYTAIDHPAAGIQLALAQKEHE